MALIRDFEVPETGLVVPNAYHLIVNVATEKRLNDIKPPVDSGRESGLSERDDDDESQWVYWKKGYVGRITIEVYTSRDARDAGKKPVGAIGLNPTEVQSPDLDTVSNPKDFKIEFFINPASEDSILTQAYAHLKGTEYYRDAQEA